MGVLKVLGAGILIVWLVLWLVVKVTMTAIHVLVVLGLVLLLVGFIKRS